MPRSSRQKSHRQNYKESSLHPVDDGSPAQYKPGVLPKSPEAKRNKDEVGPDPLKGERELNADNGAASSRGKRKSPNSAGLGPSESSTSKRRLGAGSVSAGSLPDRWNGGEAEGDALSLLAYLDYSKEKDSKADSDSSGGNPGVAEARALKSEEKGHRKLKETEGIAVSDLVNSPHIKSRAPQRKETVDAYVQGSAQKCPDNPPVNLDSDALSRGAECLPKSEASPNLNRDREVGRKDTREFQGRDLHREPTVGRPKNVQDTKQKNSSDNPLSGSNKNSQGTGNERSHKGHILEESFQEGRESTEWRIQAEHRNLELEKELENRIRRRREGSGERDRQWDDDRNREPKLGHSRESLPRNDRYKDERQRDDNPRDDRLKVETQRDDTLRDDRFKDDKRRDGKGNPDRHKGERQKFEREDHHGDVRHRDDRHREDKYREDSYRADKYRGKKNREEMLSRECSGDRYDSRNPRNETSLREGHYKPSTCYASDQDYGSYHDDQYTERDGYNDINRDSHKSGAYRQRRAHGNKGSPSEQDHVRTRKGFQDDVLVQGKMASGLPSLNAAGAGKDANWKRRDRDTDCCDSDRDQKRRKDASFEERAWHPRGKQNTHNFEQLGDYSNKRSRSRTEWQGDAHGDREELPLGNANSPLRSNGCLSPMKMVQGSLSPSVSERTHPSSYDRPTKRKRLENDCDISGASGMQRQRGRSGNCPDTLDRGKAKLRPADEIRYRESRVVLSDRDKHRDRSASRDRDGFSRGPPLYAADSRIGGLQDEAIGLDSHAKQFLSSDCRSPSDEEPKSFGHSEQMNSSRSGWPAHRIQNSRSVGVPGRPRASSYPVRPSGHLPPPPPVRPNIDNPAIMGPPTGSFEEKCVKEGRGDLKGNASLKRGELDGIVRNWNSQAQSTGPNNIFMPIPHQIGGHPSGVFSSMGQQYTGLPLRGVRPSTGMNQCGVPYHMWDGGDVFLGHNSTFNWHGPANHVRGPNVYGSLHAWNGQAPYGGEPLGYGQPGYYPIGQGMSSQWWDRGAGTWKGHSVDTSKDFLTQRESGYPSCQSACESWGRMQDSQEKLRRQRSPTESIEIKTSDKGRAKILRKSSGGGSSSDARKSNKNGSDTVRSYLLHLDVSEDLAGSDLYNQYVSLLGVGKPTKTCSTDFSANVIADSNQLEGDAEAEALLCSLDTRQKYFPTLPDNKALDIYKRSRKLLEEHIGDTFLSTPNVTTGFFEKPFPVGEGSKEICTEIAQEVPETSLQCDGNRDDVVKQKQDKSMSDAIAMGFSEELIDGVNAANLLGAGKCSGDSLSSGKESILTDNMMTRDRVLDIEKRDADLIRAIDDGRSLVAAVDCYTPPVDSCNAAEIPFGEPDPVPTPESECNSKKLVKNCGEDESGSRMLDTETTSMCERIHEGNPVKGDLCEDQVTYENESLKSTERVHKKALLFDLDESKELVSAACCAYLEGSFFTCWLPALLPLRLVEVSICNVS